MSSQVPPRFAAVQRVSQLDALRFDDELLSLFLDSLRDCLRFFPQSTLETHLPELKALIRLFFHLNTVFVQKASPGNAFQNLRYNPLSPAQRAAHLALDVLLPYAFANLRRRVSATDWSLRGGRRRRLWQVLNYVEGIGRLAIVINLALFFRNGVYRSVADRVVGARLSYAKRAVARAPAFEFVNAQLVWEGVAEFALLLSPLLSAHGWLGRSSIGRRVLAGLGVSERGGASGGEGAGVERCGVCGAAEMRMKHCAKPCGHLFCYACVAEEVERDPGCRCRVCSVGVHAIERVKFG